MTASNLDTTSSISRSPITMVLVVLFLAVTAFFGYRIREFQVYVAPEKSLPLNHPYLVAQQRERETFPAGNEVVVAVFPNDGDIFSKSFFEVIQRVTDDLFFMPGINRSTVQSIVTANTTYIDIVEDGFVGGTVVPEGFQGTDAELLRVRSNLLKSTAMGWLVGSGFEGAIVQARLVESDTRPVDYEQLAEELETRFRRVYETEGVTVRLLGFPKLAGEVFGAVRRSIKMVALPLLALLLLSMLAARSKRGSSAVLLGPLLGLIWQVGLGLCLFPEYHLISVLVISLFACIQLAHAAYVWQRLRDRPYRTLPRQYLKEAFMLLLANGLAFGSLYFIEIPIVTEMTVLGVSGGVGLAICHIVVNFIGGGRARSASDSAAAAREAQGQSDFEFPLTSGGLGPTAVLVFSFAVSAFSVWYLGWVPIGARTEGVAELQYDAVFNEDLREVRRFFHLGADTLTVFAHTAPNGCLDAEVMDAIDDLEWQVRHVDGVLGVVSVATLAKQSNSFIHDGNLKWHLLPGRQEELIGTVQFVSPSTGLLNADCSKMQIVLILKDHLDETSSRVIGVIKEFISAHAQEKVRFELGSGNVAIFAAENETVREALFPILLSLVLGTVLLSRAYLRSTAAAGGLVLTLLIAVAVVNLVFRYAKIGLTPDALGAGAIGFGCILPYGLFLCDSLFREITHPNDPLHKYRTRSRVNGTALVLFMMFLIVGVGAWLFVEARFQAEMGSVLLTFIGAGGVTSLTVLPAVLRITSRYSSHMRADGEV